MITSIECQSHDRLRLAVVLRVAPFLACTYGGYGCVMKRLSYKPETFLQEGIAVAYVALEKMERNALWRCRSGFVIAAFSHYGYINFP